MKIFHGAIIGTAAAATAGGVCENRHRGCLNSENHQMGQTYVFSYMFPDVIGGRSTADQCLEKCIKHKRDGCTGFLADDMSKCYLMTNGLCEPKGDQNLYTNLYYFAMVDCETNDGSTELFAGSCPSNKWSNYFNGHALDEFGDRENPDTVYSIPAFSTDGERPTALGMNLKMCPRKSQIIGIKAAAMPVDEFGGHAMMAPFNGLEARTFEKGITLTLEDGLTCENIKQTEDNQCDNYGVALCCQTASEWNAWTSWSNCDQTCGGGRKQRSRTCGDDIEDEEGNVVPCNGQGEYESASLQFKSCNRNPCVLLHAELYKNEWYNKCWANGDPHITGFDSDVITVFQYNSLYTMVNAYRGASINKVFTIDMLTRQGSNSNNPRASFEAMITKFDNDLEVKADKSRVVEWRVGNGEWTRLAPGTRVVGGVRINHDIANNAAIMEFPEYDLVVTSEWYHGKVWVKTTSEFRYDGYCGNRDYVRSNDHPEPLDSRIFGSTEFVFAETCGGSDRYGSRKRCNGGNRRTARDVDEPLRFRRNVDFQNCPASADPAVKCQSIIDAFPDCRDAVSEAEKAAFKETCEIDMCFDDGPGPTKQMMDQFLNSCAALSYTTGQAVDTDCANMANVQRALTGEAPKCSDSKTFDGCATDCSYMTCARVLENSRNFLEPDECDDDGDKKPGCVCPPDTYLLNDNCVELSKCFLREWADWGEWGECEDTCLIGSTGSRTRSRFHITDGRVEDETGDCTIECKQPNDAFTVLSAGHCDSGDWQGWLAEDVAPSCEHGVTGKEGTLGGASSTKNYVSWGLSTTFECNDADQIRGFTCGAKQVRHCCGAPTELVCAEGEQKSTDGESCTSILEAQRHCPSSTCWIYEDENCVMKTGERATEDGCPMYLSCSPKIMDFRFDMTKLIGENQVDQLADTVTDCPVVANAGTMKLNDADVTPDDVDSMWKHDLGKCDSFIQRSTDEEGNEWLEIKKTIVYAADETKVGKDIDSTKIYLDDQATTSITFCCRFKSSFVAISDQIAIEAGVPVVGKLEQTGNWDESLSIKYMLEDFSAAVAPDHVSILGATHFIEVAWTVGASSFPISSKLNWFIPYCTVKNLNTDGTEADGEVNIINGLCYAKVLSTTKISTDVVSTTNFRFSYKSFSFNSAGNGKQKIECDVTFCLTDGDECSTLAVSSCPNGAGDAAYQWQGV